MNVSKGILSKIQTNITNFIETYNDTIDVI